MKVQVTATYGPCGERDDAPPWERSLGEPGHDDVAGSDDDTAGGAAAPANWA